MRSPTRSHLHAVDACGSVKSHPLESCSDADFESVLRLAEASAAAESDGHVAFHVAPDGPDILLGLQPLGAAHPFDVLAGFCAPEDWSVFGVRVGGQAHHLDGLEPSSRITATFMVRRDGLDGVLVRDVGDDTEQVAVGGGIGVIPDLCRRVLGIATAPAPSDTTGLWLSLWLDRILAQRLDHHRLGYSNVCWEDVARLHPVYDDYDFSPFTADPAELVAAARSLVVDRTWARLRAEPELAPLPDGTVPPDVAAWMDDGFFARWCLGAFPEPSALVHELTEALPQPVRRDLLEVMIEMV